MFYIHVGDSTFKFDPATTGRINLEKTDNGAFLTIITTSKYIDDIRITFQNYEDAQKSYSELATVVRMSAVEVIDIPAESVHTVEFIAKTPTPMNNVVAETAINIEFRDK